jgi:FtsH-binding integral membrane protein
MAIYGMTTKRDLTSIGAFLMVGLISLIIVSVINLFIGNSLLDLALSGIGVIIFLGFTAYDAQNIQEMVSYESNTNLEVMGALSLYLDFVNLFLDLLRLFGALASDD